MNRIGFAQPNRGMNIRICADMVKKIENISANLE
jgi:hypothetical protein